MKESYKLKLKDGELFVDGFSKTDNGFTLLLKNALHHRIEFQNGKEITFRVEQQSGDWVVQPSTSAPVGFKYFYFYIKEMLQKNGPVATLYQDTYWLDRQ